jgi:hypothetical protein
LRLILLTAHPSEKLIANQAPYAAAFRNCFVNRLTETADFPALVRAYLMTRHWLQWYRRLNSDRLGNSIFTQELVTEITRALRAPFANLLGAATGALGIAWNHHLQHGVFGADESEISYCTRIRATVIHIDGLIACSCRRFGDMNLISTTLPVVKTIERIFSHVRDCFGEHSEGMNNDLLEARVIAKLNIFLHQDNATVNRSGQKIQAQMNAQPAHSQEPLPEHPLPVPAIVRLHSHPTDF